jgi:hypothetical protein
MGAINFELIFREIKDEVINIIAANHKDLKDEIVPDISTFLDNVKDKLKQYTLQLADNDIGTSDFQYNVAGLKELCEMKVLQERGIEQIKIDKIKDQIVSSIASSIIDKL